VREELLRCNAEESSIHSTGILDYYLTGWSNLLVINSLPVKYN
jgi:hypothetical protein